jgi:hypothetical protein
MADTAPAVARPRNTRTLVGGIAATVLGVGLAWIVVTGLIAAHDADKVRTGFAALKRDLARGDERAATVLVARMQREAAAAHAHTTGPAWWLAAQVPLIGTPARSARGATRLLDQVAGSAVPPALQAGRLLNPQRLRPEPGTIDPRRLGQAAAPLGRAAAAVGAVAVKARTLPDSTWLPIVDSRRDDLVRQLDQLHQGMADLSTVARLLPSQLGPAGPKRYFLAIQTDAESRGLGGLPGAFAILKANHGQLSFDRFGSDADLRDAHAPIRLPAAYLRNFQTTFGPRSYFGNSDPSPHFPYAARIWMAMWEQKFHQRLDGAIATDATALGYLLAATGPVKLRDGTVLDQDNAVPFFDHGIYARFGRDDRRRKRYQVKASEAVTLRVIHQPGRRLLRTATALRRAANERRFLVYTRDRSVESSLTEQPVGGVLPVTDRPFMDVVVNNAGGNKLDYYLDRTVTYRRTSCRASTATVTVTLRNGAPAVNLPPTVAGRPVSDHPGVTGESDELVSLYGSAGSSVNHVTVDGKTGYLDAERERGHPVTTVEVEMAPGQSRTITFYVHEPAATAPLIALRQPLVRPLHQTIIEPDCRGFSRS